MDSSDASASKNICLRALSSLQEETMEKTESSVFLRWEPDQFRRLLLRDAETNRAKESFEADSITLKVKMFTLLTLMNTTKPFWQFSTRWIGTTLQQYALATTNQRHSSSTGQERCPSEDFQPRFSMTVINYCCKG